MHPAKSEDQKPKPDRSIAGMARNIGSDGKTYQKVAWACAAILAGSGRSRQSQIMPITEMSGREAISAPKPGKRFATVEIRAMIRPESAALITKYSMGKDRSGWLKRNRPASA